jgi:uncharacterized repeat protein (TIGR02543 family)
MASGKLHVRSRAIDLVLCLAVICTSAGVLLGGATAAQAAAPKALINASTVVGSPSQEEQIATALGFAVTVVNDATWGTLTAADFGQYDLLIAGDPACGGLPPGLVSSAPVYGPVVLGLAGGRTLAGNRIVVGTDPVFHDGGDFTSPGARGTIIREGIAFASSQPGRTGMYFDATCSDDFQVAATLTILGALSAGGGWTVDGTPPCGGSVSLIASNPSFGDLTTASLQGWGCSVHEAFPTFPTDWSALAVATDTVTKPTCGVDPGTGLNACGEAYILVAGSSIVVNSLVISVSPLDSTNPIGTTHTITANVHDASGAPPVAGQLVDFTVTGQNAGASGTCVPVDCKSNVNGDVSFTYSDGAGAGDDTIKASFTDAAGSLQTATAQKHWVASATHQLTASKAGSGGGSVTSNPAGIDCGATCSASFTSGTMVTLTATPDAGSTFTGWTGDCSGTGSCVVTMDQDRAVTATFDLASRMLSVTKAGSGSGTVTSSPAGIDCGATCAASFPNGTMVTLTATPDAGSTFTGWIGDCTGTGPCTVTMDQDRAVTASFDIVAQPGPRVLKQDAVASLQALLPTGDEQADSKIQRAIHEINETLEPQLWLDDSHLTEKGRRVFHEEKEAARALTRILNPPTIVASVLDSLVAADQALARTAIDEATASGGDPGILAEAEQQMQKAAEELAKGHVPESIEHYGRAWKKAQQAVM